MKDDKSVKRITPKRLFTLGRLLIYCGAALGIVAFVLYWIDPIGYMMDSASQHHEWKWHCYWSLMKLSIPMLAVGGVMLFADGTNCRAWQEKTYCLVFLLSEALLSICTVLSIM